MLRTKASALASKAKAIHTRAQSVHTIWQRLAPHYQAPEQEILLSAMNKPESSAEGISTSVGSVSKALHTYADDLDRLARRRAELLTRGVGINIDNQAFQERYPDYPNRSALQSLTGEFDGADAEMTAIRQRVEQWNKDVAQFIEDNFDAQCECVNAIGQIYGAKALKRDEDATPTERAAGRVYGGDASTYVEAVTFGVAERAAPNERYGTSHETDFNVVARGYSSRASYMWDRRGESPSFEWHRDPEPVDEPDTPAGEDAEISMVDAATAALVVAATRGRGGGRVRPGARRRASGGDLGDNSLLYRINGHAATGPKSGSSSNDLATAQGVAARFSDGHGPSSAFAVSDPATWKYLIPTRPSPSRSTWEYVEEQDRRRTVAQKYAPSRPTQAVSSGPTTVLRWSTVNPSTTALGMNSTVGPARAVVGT